MTTTHDATRDLVKRLLRIADGYEPTDYGIAVNLRESAARLEKLLEAVKEADRVIEPFVRLHDEIASLTELYEGKMSDPNNWSKSCTWEDLVAVAAWRAKHGAGR